MFEIDGNNLLIVRICQALLVLDLKNEFGAMCGILPVEEPAE
jgi:hypothetical protein